MIPQESVPTQAPKTTSETSRKQDEKTGHTPEAKSARKETKKEKKFTYADVTKKVTSVVLVRKNLEHVSKAEFNAVVTAMNSTMLDMAKRGEALPNIVSWVYNSKFAAFAIEDDKTENFIKTQVSTNTEGKIICMRLQDLHATRKPAITLTGHIQGPC